MSENEVYYRPPPDASGWMEAARARNKIASERAKTPLRSVALPEGTKFDGPRVQKAAAPAPAAPAPQVVSARPGANPVARATSPIEARSKSPPPSSSSSEGDAVPRKRIQSFAALVVETTSTSGGAYAYQVVGIEWRKVSLDSDSVIAMYAISVSQNGQSWTIFRRYKQFKDLDANLKKKQLLALQDRTFPSKGNFDSPGPDTKALRIAELQTYLDGITSLEAIATSPYVSSFFEPINMGDTKRA